MDNLLKTRGFADKPHGIFGAAIANCRIRTFLLGLVGIPIFALIAALAYDSYRYNQDNIEAGYRSAAAINDLTAAHTEEFLRRAEHILSELSQRPQVKALNPAGCDPLLADWKRLEPAYANVLTLDAMGHLVCSGSGTPSESSTGPDPKYYFAETVRTRRFTVGKPAKGFITGRWVSSLAYPIQDADGRLIGVVAAAVDLATYARVSNQNLPSGAVVGIINSDGVIIARSEESARVGSVSESDATRVILQQRKGKIRSSEYRGVDRFFVFTPIGRSDWIAWVSLDAATVLAPGRRIALQRLALALTLIVVIAALTLLVARRIAKPIEAISNTLAAVRKGDLGSRASIRGPIEAQLIAVELNSMLEARKLADAANERALQRLTEAQRIGQIGDWEFDLSTGAITWSPQTFEILGRDPGLGPPRSYEENAAMYEAASAALMSDKVAAVIASGEAQECQLVAIRPDGQRVAVQAMAVPRKDETGKVVGINGTVQDVSERKRAEEAALQLAAIVESSDDAIVGKDLSGLVTSWNAGAERLFGYAAAEMIGQPIPRIIPPERHAEEANFLAQITRGETVRHFETVRLRKDGSTIDISITVSAIRDAAGNIVGTSKMARDITERKRAEESMELERQKLAAVIENTHIGFVLCDAQGGRMSMNPAALRFHGFASVAEMHTKIGDYAEKWELQYLDGRLMPVPEWPMSRAINGDFVRDYEVRLRNVQGYEWIGSFTSTAMRNSAGVVMFLVLTVLDITERKIAEAALRESQALLENTERLGGIGGWDWDIPHDTLFWSKETYRMLDRPQGSVVKVRDFLAAVRAEDRPGVEAAIAASLAGEKPYDIQVGIQRADGSQRICRVRGEVIRDAQGRSTRMTGTMHDITDIKLAEGRLAHLAQHDALTDLPNRVLLTDRLNVALARAQRSGKPLALLFLDLDRFKNVNDVLGHEQGDRVLVEAAARLKSCVRASDTVSRQGGDEFLVLLADIESAQNAARVSQKLIEAVSRPYVLGGAEFVLTASIGIACHPENGADAETLMRNADAAMYAAKQGGRNRYQFYSAEMNARARDRLRLETDLRHAIARGELFLAYQPQLDLGSGMVIGTEALIRWQHPTLGLVPPASFIGIAEDSGQIVAIGAWVLETACRQQAAWVAEGLTAGVIAVNVSAHQFRQVEFAESVAATLASSGLPAGHLELEVTESAIMQGVEDMLRKLGQLDRLGVKLSIDDFGTGYSSLSYLKQFPIYRLKIDQSFTRGLPDDAESGAIVQAVISMGHSLGLNVLAEGVETAAQEEHLRELWCDAAQGYLYSKPVPADAYAAFLRARATTPGA